MPNTKSLAQLCALACRDRTDTERVLATVLRADKKAYADTIMALIFTGIRQARYAEKGGAKFKERRAAYMRDYRARKAQERQMQATFLPMTGSRPDVVRHMGAQRECWPAV